MGYMKHKDLPPRLNVLTDHIIGYAIQVHRTLGFGLLEHLYEHAFGHELKLAGLHVDRPYPIMIDSKGLDLANQILDLRVEHQIEVGLKAGGLKAGEKVANVHLAHMVSDLNAGNFSVGLLINFHVPVLRDGVSQRINTPSLFHSESYSAPPTHPTHPTHLAHLAHLAHSVSPH